MVKVTSSLAWEACGDKNCTGLCCFPKSQQNIWCIPNHVNFICWSKDLQASHLIFRTLIDHLTNRSEHYFSVFFFLQDLEVFVKSYMIPAKKLQECKLYFRENFAKPRSILQCLYSKLQSWLYIEKIGCLLAKNVVIYFIDPVISYAREN
jgi:hypothetical protein